MRWSIWVGPSTSPRATSWPATSSDPSLMVTSSPSRIRSSTSAPTSSTSTIPDSTTQRGPLLGYRPEIEEAALTTAASWAAASPSPATLSRSWWSITAMSPGFRRLIRSLVRRPTLARPVTDVRVTAATSATELRRSLRRDGAARSSGPAAAEASNASSSPGGDGGSGSGELMRGRVDGMRGVDCRSGRRRRPAAWDTWYFSRSVGHRMATGPPAPRRGACDIGA